jgi:hypothetical protein
VITSGIRDYVARDWAAVRERKDAYWAERISRLGAAEAFRVTEELRREAQLCNPGWPSAADRHADFEAHVRVAALFQRVDSTRRG